jgi:hypothetical protein
MRQKTFVVVCGVSLLFLFHHIFLVFDEKLTILFIIEATRVKLMKKKKKIIFCLVLRKMWPKQY